MSFGSHLVGSWARLGLKNSEKPNGFLIFLYFSWKAILSPKMRPRGARDDAKRRGGTKAEIQGED